jgi:D-serine deaminase-like pyridoxal phosphate-dependent protein
MSGVDRRCFLAAASLGAGLALQSRTSSSSIAAEAEAQLQESALKMTKDEIPTPALLLDLDAFEANLRTIAEHCQNRGCAARPHAKTHKCPEIARRQVALGARGVAVATVPEAEAMVAAGISGVLLTSPIFEPRKIALMVSLAKKSSGLLLAVGSARQAEMLAAAAEAEGVKVDVLLDLDVGDHRFGSAPGAPAQELARQISRYASLRLRGVQAYSGMASHTKGFEARREASRNAMGLAVQTREQLAKDGHDMAILSGGSTGTYNIDCDLPGGVELQVGSYVFMDVQYRNIGGKNSGALYTDFQPSLTVLTTVVNTNVADRVSVDAGVKSFATESPTLPEAKGWDGLRYAFAGDEFGRLTTVDGGKLPRLGDRLEFYVPHCDPTVNLYDRIYAMRRDRIEALWPVVARKEARNLQAPVTGTS